MAKVQYFLLCLLVSFTASGQGKKKNSQKKVYFDILNDPTDSARSHYYHWLNPVKLSGKASKNVVIVQRDTVVNFYTGNDKPYSSFSTAVLNPNSSSKLVRVGKFLAWYPDGQVKAQGFFANDHLQGLYVTFFPDGRKNAEYDFGESGDNPRLLNYWDPEGRQPIRSGNGMCGCVARRADDTPLIQEGTITNGLKESLWTVYENGEVIYRENYVAGTLITGERYVDGQTLPYEKAHEDPEFEGGDPALYRFLQDNLEFRRKPQRKYSGQSVLIEFIVNPDGSLSDVKTMRGVAPAIDAEAERVVRNMPPWNPARDHGLPVRQRYFVTVMLLDPSSHMNLRNVPSIHH